MATEVTNANLTAPRASELQTNSLQDDIKLLVGSGPFVDNEGNVVQYATNKVQATKEKYCQPSPIARLAAAAAFSNVIPTAGGYAISRCKEPQVDYPECCMMYEEERPWVLGKMNPAALTDPEPEEAVVEEPLVEAPTNIQDVKEAQKVKDENNNTIQFDNVKDAPKVESTAAPKNAPVAKNVKKLSKSRNASPSPVRASSGKSPRLQQQDKAKTSKSPGRSSDPAGKMSPRTGAKKIVNAKGDHVEQEI